MPAANRSFLSKASVAVFFAIGLTGNAAGAEREVRVGTPTGPSISSSKLIAASELGYFAEEGLKLNLQHLPTTLPIMRKVAAKELDIGGGGVFPLVVINQPGGKDRMPIKFFYNHIRNLAFEIVVLPNSPLKGLEDLKGKKLGVAFLGTPYEPVMHAILKDKGLARDDVQIVQVGENRAAFDLLEKGELDAYETFVGNSAGYEAEGNKLRRLQPAPRFTNNLLTYSYYAHEDTVKNDPKLLVGFGRAVAKGVLTCRKAPEWCVKTFWKHYPDLKPAPEKFEQELARQVFMLNSGNAGHFTFPPGKPQRFGEYPETAFKNIIEILHGGGQLTTGNIDPNIFYTNDLVAQINTFDVAAVEARAATLK